MKIYRNKHPAGIVYNIRFGLCEILDGLLRILTLGMFCSTFVIDCARESARVAIERMKEDRSRKSQEN